MLIASRTDPTLTDKIVASQLTSAGQLFARLELTAADLPTASGLQRWMGGWPS